MPTFSKFLNGFRGCKQVLDSDGYIYSRKKNDDTVLSSAWRCQKNKSLKCPGKCYLALTDNTLSLGSKPHNHDSDLATPQRLELLTTLKRKAAEQPLSATQNLISEVLADASTEVPPTYPLEFWNHFASILQDPEFPRTSNMVEGFHRGFKTRVNRPKPSVQEYFRATGCYRLSSGSACCWKDSFQKEEDFQQYSVRPLFLLHDIPNKD